MVVKKKSAVVKKTAVNKKKPVKKTVAKKPVKKATPKKKPPPKKTTRAKAKPGDKRIGNEFWKCAKVYGSEKIFKNPQVLWEQCSNYFQWSVDNPIEQEELVKHSGNAKRIKIYKRRPFTMNQMCIRLGIGTSTWNDYKNDKNGSYKEYSEVIDMVETIIYSQKFDGAAINEFNANIISRELGLVDKTQQDTTINMKFDSEDEDA